MIRHSSKKVLFIQHRMGDGGVTYSLSNLLNFLCKNRNWEITLLLKFRDNSPRMDLIPKGVKQLWFDNCDDNFFLSNYDVVVAYMPDMIDVLEKFSNAQQKVLWIHGDYSNFNSDIKEHIISCMNKVDIVITPSTRASASIIDLLPTFENRVFTIPHTMQDKLIRKLSFKEINDWPESEKLSIITVGKLLYNAKGIDRMIRIHRKLLDDGFDFRWIIIGDGPDRTWIEELIKENNLEEYFILLGFRKNPYPYVRMADLFAILSYHEGYCLALNEAKILGKPIIATNFAGASDQITHLFNGIVIENNEEGIYEGMKLILTDGQLRKQFSNNLKCYTHPNTEILNKIDDVFIKRKTKRSTLLKIIFPFMNGLTFLRLLC